MNDQPILNTGDSADNHASFVCDVARNDVRKSTDFNEYGIEVEVLHLDLLASDDPSDHS